MKLMASCGHTFNWPDRQVAPDSIRCAACGETVAVYGLTQDRQPTADRWTKTSTCECGGEVVSHGGIDESGEVWGGNCTRCGRGYGDNEP